MDPGNGDPIALNEEIRSLRQMAEATSRIAQRLELKVDALCQLLTTKGTITSDDYKRLTLWGTDSTR